jgi:hypothetical protein
MPAAPLALVRGAAAADRFSCEGPGDHATRALVSTLSRRAVG